MPARQRRRSGVSWLALGYLAVVVHASLYPFSPWTWPDGLDLLTALQLPWPQYWSRFDIWANAVGYVPLGLLVVAAAWRSGAPGWLALLLGLLLPSLAAYGIELAQRFVALRVPSLADWALNSGGALLGAVLAGLAAWRGWLERWGQWRERWFLPHSAGALALLALWPLGLLFPLPAPLAQGQFIPPLMDAVQPLLVQAGWISEITPWAQPVGQLHEGLATTLGLLSPCLLLLAVSRPGWHRLALLASVLLVGIGMSALAAALGFGPPNAWSWLTPRTMPALGLGLGLALVMALFPARVCALLALPALTALVLLVARMDPDPFLLLNLQRWEHGPRVEFYGLLQWLGWLWPALTMGWLLFGLSRGAPT